MEKQYVFQGKTYNTKDALKSAQKIIFSLMQGNEQTIDKIDTVISKLNGDEKLEEDDIRSNAVYMRDLKNKVKTASDARANRVAKIITEGNVDELLKDVERSIKRMPLSEKQLDEMIVDIISSKKVNDTLKIGFLNETKVSYINSTFELNKEFAFIDVKLKEIEQAQFDEEERDVQ